MKFAQLFQFVVSASSSCVLDTKVDCNGCRVQFGSVSENSPPQTKTCASECGSTWQGSVTGQCNKDGMFTNFEVTACSCEPKSGPSPPPSPSTLTCLGGADLCGGCAVSFTGPLPVSATAYTEDCSAHCKGFSGTVSGFCRQIDSQSTQWIKNTCTCSDGKPTPAPPSPPPPTPSAADWPTFTSKAELSANPWGTYFQVVYGAVPDFDFPLYVGDFWMLYDDVAADAGTPMPDVFAECPTRDWPEFVHYTNNNLYQPNGVSWIWHPPPYSAFPGNTWVEVTHESDPWGDEGHGAWLLYAKGSGIWFNLGKTISFAEHQDAYEHFAATTDPDMSQKAAARGYDSIQFLAHVDGDQYRCDSQHTNGAGPDYMNIEVVCTACVGTYACMGQGGAPSSIRKGWKGSKACTCDNSLDKLNCAGVPYPPDSMLLI